MHNLYICLFVIIIEKDIFCIYIESCIGTSNRIIKNNMVNLWLIAINSNTNNTINTTHNLIRILLNYTAWQMYRYRDTNSNPHYYHYKSQPSNMSSIVTFIYNEYNQNILNCILIYKS